MAAGERRTIQRAAPDEVWETALLALRLGDEDLSAELGGPVRLVVPGHACFASVKWLDHLELRATAGANTAEEIARGRLVATELPVTT